MIPIVEPQIAYGNRELAYLKPIADLAESMAAAEEALHWSLQHRPRWLYLLPTDHPTTTTCVHTQNTGTEILSRIRPADQEPREEGAPFRQLQLTKRLTHLVI